MKNMGRGKQAEDTLCNWEKTFVAKTSADNILFLSWVHREEIPSVVTSVIQVLA